MCIRDRVISGLTTVTAAYQPLVGPKRFTWQKGRARQRLNKCGVSHHIYTLLMKIQPQHLASLAVCVTGYLIVHGAWSYLVDMAQAHCHHRWVSNHGERQEAGHEAAPGPAPAHADWR